MVISPEEGALLRWFCSRAVYFRGVVIKRSFLFQEGGYKGDGSFQEGSYKFERERLISMQGLCMSIIPGSHYKINMYLTLTTHMHKLKTAANKLVCRKTAL